MHWYIDALKNYFKFSGRASRRAFWMYVLIATIISVVCFIADYLVFKVYGPESGPIRSIYILITFIPGLAVSVRRLHDVDFKGWWILVPIYPLYLLCKKGTKDSNRFGPSSEE